MSCSGSRCDARGRHERPRPPARHRRRPRCALLHRRERAEPHLRPHGRAQLRARRLHDRRGVCRLADDAGAAGRVAGGRAPARRRRRCRGGRGRGGSGRRGRPDPPALSPPHPAGAGHGGPLACGCRCGTRHLGSGPAAGGHPRLDGGDDRRARRPAPERPLRLRRRRRRALRRAPRPAAPDAPRTRHPGRGREPDDGRGPRHQRPPDLHGRLRPRRRGGRHWPGRCTRTTRGPSHPRRAARCSSSPSSSSSSVAWAR